MRRISGYLCAVLLTTLFFTACKKGDIGPEGPQGPQGPTGNPDVKMFKFGPQTFTGALNLKLPGLKQGYVDSSLVLVFYNPSTEVSSAWYPCPGLGSGSVYDTRYFIYQSSVSPEEWSLSIRLVKPDGSGSYASAVTFTKTKIIFAPASSIQTGRGAPVDLKDYNAVKNYFNLPD
ncbi:MAG TPA: hypothetical protein VHN59_16105 [Chitinophagaceae bacterium]|nr:hypothetical protein [Chitinophagaceae bacterium]